MKYILVINLVVTRIIHNTHIFLHFQLTCLVSVRHEGIFIILAEGDLLLILPGLHNLFHPTIRDGSMWSKFGAHGEHGDVFLFSNLGAL